MWFEGFIFKEKSVIVNKCLTNFTRYFPRGLTDSETPGNLDEENSKVTHWEGILMISNISISTFPIKKIFFSVLLWTVKPMNIFVIYSKEVRSAKNLAYRLIMPEVKMLHKAFLFQWQRKGNRRNWLQVLKGKKLAFNSLFWLQ